MWVRSLHPVRRINSYNMNVAFVISVYLLFVSLLVKIIIHIYLDNANGHKIVVSPISSFVYLLLYDKKVAERYEKKKGFCNNFTFNYKKSLHISPLPEKHNHKRAA